MNVANVNRESPAVHAEMQNDGGSPSTVWSMWRSWSRGSRGDGYTSRMARGWESKAVEDQIGAAEAEREARAKPVLTPLELEHRSRRDGLMLARARVVSAREAARDERYRALLERALAHVDAELGEL
jgi:hypothetical protein